MGKHYRSLEVSNVRFCSPKTPYSSRSKHAFFQSSEIHSISDNVDDKGQLRITPNPSAETTEDEGEYDDTYEDVAKTDDLNLDVYVNTTEKPKVSQDRVRSLGRRLAQRGKRSLMTNFLDSIRRKDIAGVKQKLKVLTKNYIVQNVIIGYKLLAN